MEWLPEVPGECERKSEVFSGQGKSLSPEQFDRLTSLLPIWWQKGGRHHLAMSIAGVMAKEGYTEAEADRLVCAVCGRAGDLEFEDRRGAVRDTFRACALGQQVAAWSGIEGVYPNDSVAYFRNILAAPTLVTDRGPPAEEEDDRYQTPFRLTERQDFPVVPMLMQGILPSDPRGVVGYLAGLSQSFKSYLALDWGCHVSLGLEWQGHATTQGQVLYVAGEGQYGDLLSRMRAWEAANGCKAPDFYTRLSPIYLDDAVKVERALRRIEKVDLEPKLVILDTLSQCAGDIAENSSDDARRIYHACKAIGSHFGATVLVIHHSGKADGAIMRGSSALFDDSDFVYEMRRPGWQGGGLDCALNCKKLKNGKPLFGHNMMARVVQWEADNEKGSDLVLVQMMIRSAFEAPPTYGGNQ